MTMLRYALLVSALASGLIAACGGGGGGSSPSPYGGAGGSAAPALGTNKPASSGNPYSDYGY